MLSSLNVNETCKNYLEKKIPEKYIFFKKVFMNKNKGQFGYLNASSWYYKHEQEKTTTSNDYEF